VEGRKILDNIILTHELVHSLQATRKPSMLIKLDMSKDFDILSWDYIPNTLSAFDFSSPWIKWINGSPSPTFSSTKGIRKGDPLSPFLFILMEERMG
jgi:hypothetical protein